MNDLFKIKKVGIQNELYPPKLREILEDAPKNLYVLGNEKILSNDSISIVGSRHCTKYGEKIANDFAKELAQNEITIVSGMAEGIDSSSHLGAIEAGRKNYSGIRFRI